MAKPFPTHSPPQHANQEDFEREVAARFGLVPNFFRSGPDAPFVVREFWPFAKAAYLDSPIPTLFKERLFAYLSRFCEIRYCVTRHCGFLLGLGRSAGDPNAPVMTIAQVVRLLQRPVSSDQDVGASIARLEAIVEPIDWPSPETSHDEDLLNAIIVLFLQPAHAARPKRALRIALGGEKFELLIAFLTFIRAAHYWTLMHPELAIEDDLKELLREHEQLAALLAEVSEAGRSEMAARLSEELTLLREVNEREELEIAKRTLEEGARVAAIAAVSQQLHRFNNIEMVALDQHLVDLGQEIAAASSGANQTWTIAVDAAPLVIRADLAAPLGLIVSELVTSAIQHSRPSSRGGRVQIVLETATDSLSIRVCDEGVGPPSRAEMETPGLSARMVQAFVRQIDGVTTRERRPEGYAVTVTVPRHASRAFNPT